MKKLLILILVAVFSAYSFTPIQYKRIKKFSFLCSDSSLLEGRLWFPQDISLEILVLDVRPCLVTELPPDSSKEDRFDLLLRKKLIEGGAIYCEMAGRKDSISIFGEKYPSSTYKTKAEDVKNAIQYLKTRNETKNKRIILIGQSEGGTTSMKVASANPNIQAMVLLSTPALSGYETLIYQSRCRDSVFMTTFGTHPEVFVTLNEMSSVKEKLYECSFEGYSTFKKDMFDPLAQIVYRYENNDTIAAHIIQFLQNKWKREDAKTKSLHKNFNNYCKAHQYTSFLRPENIAKLKAIPELYLPNISCPILAVYGTNDRNVEYSSSLKSMKDLLNQGGNYNFTAITLKDHDHLLIPPRGKQNDVRDKSIADIIKWIMEQK